MKSPATRELKTDNWLLLSMGVARERAWVMTLNETLE